MSTSTKTISQLDAEAKGLLVGAKKILDDRDNHTPEEVEGAFKSIADAESIVKRLEGLSGLDAMKTIDRIENSIADLNQPRRPNLGTDGVATNRDGRQVAIGRHEVKSAGEMFLESDAFAGWLKSIAPSGHIPTRTAFQSPAVEVKTLIYSGSETSGGAMVFPDQRRDIVVPLPFRQFTIRDLITRLTTNSNSIEYVRVTGLTNNAAPTAEATATSGGTGAKPESAMVLEVVTDTVKTIPHWIPATTQVLQDAPQLRGLIDRFLRDGIEEELEDQIIAGDGTGQNFTGVLNTAGILTQAYTTDLITTTRKARTKVQVDGKATPTGWAFNPADWETFDLLKDGQNRYYWGGPMNMGPQRLWGLPVAESEAVTAGHALVGDWRVCVLWDRMATQISVGNQHSDFFIRNMVAILAEMRAGFGILKPSSMCDVDLTA